MTVWGATDKGVSRSQNQDYYHLEMPEGADYAIAAVCDGMGGERAGNIASELACRSFIEELHIALKPGTTERALRNILNKAIGTANTRVYEKACKEDEYAGMGTTLVCGIVTPARAIIANVGDSRAYIIDGEAISRITRDHSIVEELVEQGVITPEEARYHPRRNLITRALGTETEVRCDIYSLELRPGDRLLFCSDGLTNTVEASEIHSIVVNSDDISAACAALIAMANSRGGPDNITVILVAV
jgi:protein phosphatase